MRIPRTATAIFAAGVLFAGAAVAASAHQMSGTGSFESSEATPPRLHSPEPSESPEMDDSNIPVVVSTPTPEPSESPEAVENEDMHESENATEHESEHDGSRPTTTAIFSGDRDGSRSVSSRDGGHHR